MAESNLRHLYSAVKSIQAGAPARVWKGEGRTLYGTPQWPGVRAPVAPTPCSLIAPFTRLMALLTPSARGPGSGAICLLSGTPGSRLKFMHL